MTPTPSWSNCALAERVDWRRFRPSRRKGDPEKWRSIGALRPDRKKSTHTWVVPRDDNGKPAGTQTEHWSDRLDAHVKPETVYAKIPKRSTDG